VDQALKEKTGMSQNRSGQGKKNSLEQEDAKELSEKGEKDRINADFCKCPYCPCCFFTTSDLERHLAVFGNSKEEHFENYRRTHARIEHGSANGPE
jgi:hypothetical protein